MAAHLEAQVVCLDLAAAATGAIDGLTAGDRYRARALSNLPHRLAFLAARGALRCALASRLRCDPADLVIQTDAKGKPFLAGSGLAFSAGHRGRWCAIALSSDCPVGVDIEVVRPLPGLGAVVAEFFPPHARAALSGSVEPEAFFPWWTRIEAAVKACGLSIDDAEKCLALAPQRVYMGVPGVVVAAAGLAAEPLQVVWRVSAPAVDVAVEPGPEVLAS